MYRSISFISLFICIAFTAIFAGKVSAQDAIYNIDTVKKQNLDSVIVNSGIRRSTSPNSSFALGTNIQRASQEILSQMKTNSLADYIKEQSSIYIKEYGRGAASYLSVRGTSSSHTSVAWNGMSLSVPTMGQTNLNHVPIYFFDKLDVHIGGSSVLYGDGSIGGSLQLKTEPIWKKGYSGDLLLSAGSYSTLYTGATFRYSNKNSESRTSIFYTSAKNDYSFLNNTKPGLPKERLKNSGYINGGVLQELYKKFRDSSILSFNLWYLSFDREIQPSVSINDRPETYASVLDRNLRTSLNYSGAGSILSYSARLSFANDYERYKEDIIESSKFLGSAEAQYSSAQFMLKGGGSYEYTVPSAKSFSDSVQESRTYLFFLARYNPESFSNLILSAGARVGWVTNSKIPFMPSLDIKYTPIRSNGHTLALRAALSGNSKVPSLNDRYWGGVYTYLKSEKSFTTESGVDYSLIGVNNSFQGFITIYRSEVKDWIRWLPAGQVWRPQNIPEVISQGAEVGLSFKKEVSPWNMGATVNYSYTNVKMIKGLWSEDPSIGKQLAFQPKNSIRTSFSVGREAISSYINLLYTGERSTLDIFDMLDPYFLIDVGLSYKGDLGKSSYSVNFALKNITNEKYQNVKFYAMPGTNWQLALKYFF